MANKLEAAQQEQEAASAKAAQLRELLDATNAEFDNTKQKLSSTTKELKVTDSYIIHSMYNFISILLIRIKCLMKKPLWR